MREKFVLGIVAVNMSVPDPTEMIDFIDFDAPLPKGMSKKAFLIRTKYCAFCGEKATGTQRIT